MSAKQPLNMAGIANTNCQHTVHDLGCLLQQSFTALLNMINKVNESGLYFKRIEMLTATSVKANITDTLLCQGECINIAENTEELKAAIYDLGQKQVSRGVINVSGDGYASFNPVIR